ncbi:MAG: type VI secretion system accessory protein TagJ [Verrucomicrobia bacterium]|nr:type VI secretion system accessory protein TagJ [Verrucomicrobiota bacterium]
MSALSKINDLLLEGQLMAAVELCKQSVRNQPSSIEARVALYELSVFLGEWDRCQNQVETIMTLGGDPLHWLGHLANIHASRARCQCWLGCQRPPVVGVCDDAEQAMFAALWDAIVQAAAGDTSLTEAHVAEHGGMVFGPGKLNGVEFAEISTIDSRLPGVMEISDGGEYAWLWLGAVSRIEMQGGAKNLAEIAWIPARVFLGNGEVKAVSIFGLYPGTEQSANPLVMLGKDTEWDETHETLSFGRGGQLLYADERPIPFQQIRLIEFDGDPAAESPETESLA